MISAQRRSIEVEGFDHGLQPIPAASRVGGLVISGGIYGLDSETGKLPDDVATQTELMFQQFERIVAAAGASLGDIVRMTFYLKDPAARDHINRQWLGCFPDAASRPARHTLNYDGLPANMLVQCDFTAMVPE
ncbi:RidA family protein [Novosphingobium sp. Leaf2]|uniref:RidA family protein n=1 Tax=Novosphingobium sp. Leaf2 TaxID=1735670 RepID=UPI0006FBB009|nr:RidA family protein [Novosphingobium sp. Leaf2]KQM19852.1 endoribonuclease L-PSP [Novosphingobium sp. Leaf2]